MGSRILTQDLLLQYPTTALGISNFEKLKIKFSRKKNFLKKPEKKTSYLEHHQQI